jgi:hypothetical protein
VLVTLQRRGGSKGYFAPERFDGRLVSGGVHELALNPDAFVDRSDVEILSTLVHEQVHVVDGNQTCEIGPHISIAQEFPFVDCHEVPVAQG